MAEIARVGGEKDFPILSPKVEDGRLSFEWKEGEADDESLKCVMTLTAEGEADLQSSPATIP